MSDKIYHMENDGQAVQQADLNTLGSVAGLAGDHVYAELFRLGYGGVDTVRGILPAGRGRDGDVANEDSNPTVMPHGATGSVLVNPFRAIIGSRSDSANALETIENIRSALNFIEADSAYTKTISMGTGHGSLDRWDLIYATVAIDADNTTVTRKVKNPTTSVVTSVSTVTFKKTAVTVSRLPGTASASPVFPTITADSGSNYYIPLAYVLVPNGFSGSDEIDPAWIVDAAPVLHVSPTTGAVSAKPATSNYTLDATAQTAWANSNRPTHFLPPSLGGGETLYVAIDMSASSTANHSHADTAVIDSRDWRNRLCFWTCNVHSYVEAFPWAVGTSLTETAIAMNGDSSLYAASGQKSIFGQGQSIIQNFNGVVSQSSKIATIDDSYTNSVDSGTTVFLYVDHADGGKLKVKRTGNPRAVLIFKLDFSGPFPNVR